LPGGPFETPLLPIGNNGKPNDAARKNRGNLRRAERLGVLQNQPKGEFA
jgi:hypothetical protein